MRVVITFSMDRFLFSVAYKELLCLFSYLFSVQKKFRVNS